MTESVENVKKLLTAQTNGWLVEYYPEKTQKYGGFNLLFKFDGENVVVRSELEPLRTDSSIYALKGDMSTSLNFTTYNISLHRFSDPSLNIGGGIGLAYEGDYEFVIVSALETEFILRGKKTKNTIRMTPFPTTIDWEEFCQQILDSKPEYRPLYLHVNGNDSLWVSNDETSLTMSYKKDNVEVNKKIAYMFTPQGLKLYEDFEYAGKTYSEFILQSNNNLISAGSTFVPRVPPATWLPRAAFAGTYTLIHYTNIGGTGTPYTKTVTLTEYDNKFLLSGLMPSLNLDVVLDYHFGKGILLARQQGLRYIGGNSLNLTSVTNEFGLSPGAFYIGQQVSWDGVSDPIELTWTDYGQYGSPIIGFVLWFTNSAGLSVGQYTTGPVDQRLWTHIKMTKQ
jgi:hypothetical protein